MASPALDDKAGYELGRRILQAVLDGHRGPTEWQLLNQERPLGDHGTCDWVSLYGRGTKRTRVTNRVEQAGEFEFYIASIVEHWDTAAPQDVRRQADAIDGTYPTPEAAARAVRHEDLSSMMASPQPPGTPPGYIVLSCC